jgi:hypothetical protein
MNQVLREGFGRGTTQKQEPPKDTKKNPRDFTVEELVGAMREASDRMDALVEEVEVRLTEGAPEDVPADPVERA